MNVEGFHSRVCSNVTNFPPSATQNLLGQMSLLNSIN